MLAEFTFSIPAAISELLPLLIAFIDLLLKAALLIAFTVLVLYALRRFLAATTRHFFWLSAVLSLALLPLMPQLTEWLSVSTAAEGSATTIQAVPQLITLSSLTTELSTPVVGASEAQTLAAPDYLPALLISLYVLPILFLLAKLAYSAQYIRRVHTRSSAKCDLDVVIRVNRLRKHFAISRPVAVRFSREVESPVSFGMLHPQIVFPASARQWPERVFESALLHEFAHIQRLDWLTSALAYIVCCCYWINPLVWCAWRQLNREAENACDSAVVQAGVSSEDYAEDLLTVTRHCKHSGADNLLLQSVFGSGTLKQRVELLLTQEGERKAQHPVVRFALLSCSAILLALFSSSSLIGVNALTTLSLDGEASLNKLWANYRDYERSLDSLTAGQQINTASRSQLFDVDLAPVSPVAPIEPVPVLAADTDFYLQVARRLTLDSALRKAPVAFDQGVAELPTRVALGSPRELVPQYRLQEDAIQTPAEKPFLITATRRPVESMSKSELQAEIARVEDEFFARFNASIDDKSMHVECGTYLQTGSFIPKRYCEPRFLTDARAESLRTGFEAQYFPVGNTYNAARRSLPIQFEKLTELIDASLRQDETLLQLYYYLTNLREANG